jgi:tripeptide aminopeptidase
MEYNVEFLKEVLSVPTKTYQEELIINFLKEWLTNNGYSFFMDNMKNIYVTKKTDDVEYFPCVVSHMDTVHNIDSINISEEMLENEQGILKPSLKAYNDLGEPTGIGGDDKCGVFACLELLKRIPNIKVAFFVSEETGCHGSFKADKHFFSNVGYCIQFDAPGNTMVSEICMGVRLFNRDSEFFEKSNKVLTENNKTKYGSHPYTDVYALKSNFDFCCINFAVGYYNYHTRNEYVVIEDVINSIETGKQLIESLGNCKYIFKKGV